MSSFSSSGKPHSVIDPALKSPCRNQLISSKSEIVFHVKFGRLGVCLKLTSLHGLGHFIASLAAGEFIKDTFSTLCN